MLQEEHCNQVQDGMPMLIAYVSKRMPDAVKELFHNRAGNVWSNYKYSKFYSFVEESGF